jgi:hypothetical protein
VCSSSNSGDFAAEWLAGEAPFRFFCGHSLQAVQRLHGVEGSMGGENDILEMPETGVAGQRFFLENIESSASDSAFHECAVKRLLVDQAPPGRIHYQRSGAHRGESFVVD